MSAAHSHPHGGGIPSAVLIAAGALIAFTIGASLYSHESGVGRVALTHVAAFETLQLKFEDAANGGVRVRDAARGDVIAVIAPGTGGFLRATLRTLAQARKNDNIGAQTPFRLTRWTDGTISLEDPTTGRKIGLDAFGPDNAALFAQFFKQREETK